MGALSVESFLLIIILVVAAAYLVGRLAQSTRDYQRRLESLEHERNNKKLSRSDIAALEDAAACLVDVIYRREIEKHRDQAVEEYLSKRLHKAGEIIGHVRNGKKYNTELEADRPEDYQCSCFEKFGDNPICPEHGTIYQK